MMSANASSAACPSSPTQPALAKIANLIHQSSEGIAIPNEALTQYQGKTGVFVVERTGVAHFKAISDIAAQDNKFTAVEYAYITEAGKNSVNIYDEIILNPNNIEEGQRVK